VTNQRADIKEKTGSIKINEGSHSPNRKWGKF